MRRGPGGISAILLAAGAASRFDGGKLLAPYGGRTLIEATLANLAEAPVDETLVVLGAAGGGSTRWSALAGIAFGHGVGLAGSSTA